MVYLRSGGTTRVTFTNGSENARIDIDVKGSANLCSSRVVNGRSNGDTSAARYGMHCRAARNSEESRTGS